jgi:hypothetical protein
MKAFFIMVLKSTYLRSVLKTVLIPYLRAKAADTKTPIDDAMVDAVDAVL